MGDDTVDYEMVIPEKAVKAIMGVKGAIHQTIQNTSGARVSVEQAGHVRGVEYSEVKFSGSVEAMMKARNLVGEHLAKSIYVESVPCPTEVNTFLSKQNEVWRANFQIENDVILTVLKKGHGPNALVWGKLSAFKENKAELLAALSRLSELALQSAQLEVFTVPVGLPGTDSNAIGILQEIQKMETERTTILFRDHKPEERQDRQLLLRSKDYQDMQSVERALEGLLLTKRNEDESESPFNKPTAPTAKPRTKKWGSQESVGSSWSIPSSAGGLNREAMMALNPGFQKLTLRTETGHKYSPATSEKPPQKYMNNGSHQPNLPNQFNSFTPNPVGPGQHPSPNWLSTPPKGGPYQTGPPRGAHSPHFGFNSSNQMGYNPTNYQTGGYTGARGAVRGGRGGRGGVRGYSGPAGGVHGKAHGAPPPTNKPKKQKKVQPSFKVNGDKNILILGETGVGKSTFINSLVNYLKYDTVGDAAKNPACLIANEFHLTNSKGQTQKISTKPTQGCEQGMTKNEDLGVGKSSTQDPVSYSFKLGKNRVRIIDTPGIGDVRGEMQDNENFSKILNFIADFSELHLICILLRCNDARLTLGFRYCVDELLSHLHKSASDNIVFCFTKSSATNYNLGDTNTVLEEHLWELKQRTGVEIPTDDTRKYCFENENFRYLCAVKSGFLDGKPGSERIRAGESWNKSKEQIKRLFDHVDRLSPHKVHETLCVNNTRSTILRFSKPLVELQRNHLINERQVKEKLQEVEDLKQAGQELRARLTVDRLVINAVEIDYPQTVCTGEKCVEHKAIGTDRNQPERAVYKTCHDHCYLTGVQVKVLNNPALQSCAAMNGRGTDSMCNCGCLWSTHMHIRYKLEETMQRVIDRSVQSAFQSKEEERLEAESFIAELRDYLAEIEKERNMITSYCAEFANFLVNNSLLAYNDSYAQYVDYLIREEKYMAKKSGSDELLIKLQTHKAEYEEQVAILKTHMNKTESSRSIMEIEQMITSLKELPISGKFLETVNELEAQNAVEEVEEEEDVVEVDDESSSKSEY